MGFRLVSFMVLVPIICACSGGGSGDAQESSSNLSTESAALAWPGRVWFVDSGVLYASSYADEKKAVVDKAFQLDSLISPIVAPNATGEYYLIYSPDSYFTRTDFSVRNAADAKELYKLTAEKGTYSAALSNDGRFMALQWADQYDADNKKPAVFSIIELRSVAEGGVRWIVNLPNVGNARADLKTYRWLDGGRLVYGNAAGELFEYTVSSGTLGKVLTLPVKYGEYSIDFSSVAIDSRGQRLAGLMGIDENHREVWSMNIDGSNFAVVTNFGLGLTTVGWSPDGQWLHTGDCRIAEYGGTPTYSIPIGRFSWIFPSSAERMSQSIASKYAANYLHREVYDFYMPCGFRWTN